MQERHRNIQWNLHHQFGAHLLQAVCLGPAVPLICFTMAAHECIQAAVCSSSMLKGHQLLSLMLALIPLSDLNDLLKVIKPCSSYQKAAVWHICRYFTWLSCTFQNSFGLWIQEEALSEASLSLRSFRSNDLSWWLFLTFCLALLSLTSRSFMLPLCQLALILVLLCGSWNAYNFPHFSWKKTTHSVMCGYFHKAYGLAGNSESCVFLLSYVAASSAWCWGQY